MAQGEKYKADWHGRDLITVDRWFPSSKLCSACGALAERMPPHVRSWTCRAAPSTTGTSTRHATFLRRGSP